MKVIAKKDVLKAMFSHVLNITEEVKFVFGKSKVSCSAVDPAHISMISMEVNPDIFEEYDVPNDDGEALGLNLHRLMKVISLSNGNESITLQTDMEDNTLSISFGNIIRKMILIDTSNLSDPNVPILQMKNKVTINPKLIKTMTKVAQDITDWVEIRANEDDFTMFSEGELGSGKMTISKSELTEYEFTEPTTSKYALDYMNKIISACTNDIEIYFSENYPVRLETEDNGANITYLLAPRIEA